MELADLADRMGAFYVPAFHIRVGGRSLLRDIQLAVTQVEVDLSLGVPGRFSFTVVGCFDMAKRQFQTPSDDAVLDILSFGASVEVLMGYGGQSELRLMITGIITEISTSFGEGGAPELSIAGYDNLFALTLGSRSESWKDSSDSDVVQKIAAAAGLSTDMDQTGEKHRQVEQNQRSDIDFIKELAGRNHFEFYMSGPNRLRFGRPNDRGDGLVTLRWGKGLLSFRPEANLATQISAVEIRHRDANTNKEIVGRAEAKQASGIDPGRKSPGELVKMATGKSPTLTLRQPVFTEAEARRRAEAILSDASKKFLTGEAECIGMPDLRPDCNVNIADIGKPFSKTYYVEHTTHKVDSAGYRTRFKVKETSL